MIRLLAGGGALAVLVVAGCAAGSGLNRPVAAPPAGSARSRGTALRQSVITGRFVLFGTMGRLTTVSQNGTEREDKIFLHHPVTVTAAHTTKIVLRADVP